MENFYETLNIPEDADNEVIKSAFRKLAKQYHPDTSHGDGETFRKISDAYRVLSDPDSRLDYDKTLNNFRKKTSDINDYNRNVHTVKGKHLKTLVSEILKHSHLTSITIRYKGKKIFDLSFPVAAGLMIVGLIQAPLTFLILQIGMSALFEIEFTNEAVTLYQKAVFRHESGNIAEAERLYKAILKKSEFFIPALLNLGMLYRQRGENQKAVEYFKKVLDLAPYGEIGDIAKKQLREIRGF